MTPPAPTSVVRIGTRRGELRMEAAISAETSDGSERRAHLSLRLETNVLSRGFPTLRRIRGGQSIFPDFEQIAEHTSRLFLNISHLVLISKMADWRPPKVT